MCPCVRQFNRCCLIAEQSKLQITGSNPCSSSVVQAIENRPQSFGLGWDFILMTSNIKVFLDGLRNEHISCLVARLTLRKRLS